MRRNKLAFGAAACIVLLLAILITVLIQVAVDTEKRRVEDKSRKMVMAASRREQASAQRERIAAQQAKDAADGAHKAAEQFVAAMKAERVAHIRQLSNIRCILADTLIALGRNEEARDQMNDIAVDVLSDETKAGHTMPEFDEIRQRLAKLRERLGMHPAK